MGNGNWYKVDNVAKVFLATVTKRDTRTLRVSCILKEKIDPALLQEAVLSAIQDRPQFQVRFRRGLFWHYMEDTDIQPVVTEESDRICPLLYESALSDGSGALEFLNIIVLDYLRLKYPGKLSDVTIHSGASAGDLSQDSFRQFFENKTLSGGYNMTRAYHPGGIKLPYDQLQFFEIHMPADKILARARELKVSLTSYLGASWMMAIRDEMPPRKRKLPVTITLPVDLRNYFPSQTSRNFFNNVYVTHKFEKDITLDELATEFDASLKSQLTEENIKKQMERFETFEYVAPVRAVPLLIKQLVVRYGTKASDNTASMVFSNLGRLNPPAEVGEYIDNYSTFCSSENLFATMSTYNGDLTLGVTSPYLGTNVVRNFVRTLSRSDVNIRVYATEVIGL